MEEDPLDETLNSSPRSLLIALNLEPGLSREAICRLGEHAAALATAGRRQAAALARRCQVPQEAVAAAQRLAPRAPRRAAREEQRAADAGATIVTRGEPLYPRLLCDLELPPPVLYLGGALDDQPAVAMVGSRHADVYGLEAARTFATALARAGLAVVSGFALGIDAASHRAALEAGGRTIAVLGAGVDVPYPGHHRELAPAVTRAGALVSEFPIGARPERWRFPVRNRLIAALAAGTFVVRATPRSGSLITARHSLELGREVWALPGNVFDRRSVGPNTLIRDGAIPVQEPRDLLEGLPLAIQERLETGGAASTPPAPPEGDAGALLAALPRGETLAQEEILDLSPLGVDRTLATLLELELAGFVRRYPGAAYCRSEPGR